MPRVKRAPKRSAVKRSATGRRILRTIGYKRLPLMKMRRSPIQTNTAAVRENYTTSIADGTMTYFSVALANAVFDRAQQVATAFQEYRVKYIKLTFRPSADTFAPAAGNIIPQLYFQMNKYQALPTGASLTQLLDMGCRPIRFDDKNITRAWKPCVLLGADVASPGLSTSAAVKVTPWLSTNGFAGNPGSYTMSDIEHLGCVWIVTKPNPATPTINYNVDVEVVFQFRRPLSVPVATQPYQKLLGDVLTQYDSSGNVVSV